MRRGRRAMRLTGIAMLQERPAMGLTGIATLRNVRP